MAPLERKPMERVNDNKLKIRQITPEMLQNLRDACYYRFAICQETNGAHFEHLLYSVYKIGFYFLARRL
jgi:hypothetical protein